MSHSNLNVPLIFAKFIKIIISKNEKVRSLVVTERRGGGDNKGLHDKNTRTKLDEPT